VSIFDSDKPIVLNIGCGNRRVKDFYPFFNQWKELTLDLYVEEADIKSDIVTLDGVPDESVDCIWASHVVEHQYWHEMPDVFSNMIRVLKPTGFAVIKVPDLAAIASRIEDGLIEPIGNIENGYINLST
jgi:predicted SAM-dependent methyltransferase